MTKLSTSSWSANRSVPCLGVPKLCPLSFFLHSPKHPSMLSMRTPSSCSKERGKEKNRYKKEQQQQHKINTAELQRISYYSEQITMYSYPWTYRTPSSIVQTSIVLCTMPVLIHEIPSCENNKMSIRTFLKKVSKCTCTTRKMFCKLM